MTHESETPGGKIKHGNLAVFIWVKPLLSNAKHIRKCIKLNGWFSVLYKLSKSVVY